MAWRIHDSIQRGEVDNRRRGIVRGRLWIDGCPEPIRLELKGNACPDLAGCLLTFTNPGETNPLPPDANFAWHQRGTIGDLTASRKVRVYDLPLKEALERLEQELPVPEHVANCLYLEWFSEANGRVVIESTEYELRISPPAWKLTAAEEQQRAQSAADGFSGFLSKLTEALEARKHEPPADKEWDEFDYEKLLRESDARADKYLELLDKYQDQPDAERRIAEEMDGDWLAEAMAADEPASASTRERDAGAGKGGPTECGAEAEADDAPLPEPDPATEGIDWIRTEDGDMAHPLVARAHRSCVAFWRQCRELGLRKGQDGDLFRLVTEYQTTCAKLAGALNGLAFGRDLQEGAFVVACLKRALNHLHAAQAALEAAAPKAIIPAELVAATRAELFALREATLQLMQEFRGA